MSPFVWVLICTVSQEGQRQKSGSFSLHGYIKIIGSTQLSSDSCTGDMTSQLNL